jgi:ABC-2 type transport system permease protein
MSLTAVAAVPGVVLAVIVPAAGIDIPMSHVIAASVGLVALAWCFAGIAFLAGAATGRRGPVLAVTGVIAVATYMANALANLTDGLSWLRYLSPFHYFIGVDPLRTGWHPGALALLVAVAAGTVIAGVILFDRRDVGV